MVGKSQSPQRTINIYRNEKKGELKACGYSGAGSIELERDSWKERVSAEDSIL